MEGLRGQRGEARWGIGPGEDIHRVEIAVGGDEIGQAIGGAKPAYVQRVDGIIRHAALHLEHSVGVRREQPDETTAGVGRHQLVARRAGRAKRKQRIGWLREALLQGILDPRQFRHIGRRGEHAAPEAPQLTHAVRRPGHHKIDQAVAIEIARREIARAAPHRQRLRRRKKAATLVDEEINIARIRRGDGDVGASIAGQVGADDAAQFLRTGLKMSGRAKRSVAHAEVERDRAIRVGHGQIGFAIAVEIGHRDAFRTIDGIGRRNGGVAHLQARREGLKVLE